VRSRQWTCFWRNLVGMATQGCCIRGGAAAAAIRRPSSALILLTRELDGHHPLVGPLVGDPCAHARIFTRVGGGARSPPLLPQPLRCRHFADGNGGGGDRRHSAQQRREARRPAGTGGGLGAPPRPPPPVGRRPLPAALPSRGGPPSNAPGHDRGGGLKRVERVAGRTSRRFVPNAASREDEGGGGGDALVPPPLARQAAAAAVDRRIMAVT